MRRQFFRLLISIVSITLAILFAQCCLLILLNFMIARNWTDNVFDEFAHSIGESAVNSGPESSDGIVNIMLNNTSERVTGLIVRDGDGKFAFSLGVSPRGVPVPQLAGVSGSGMLVTDYQSSRLRTAGNATTSKGETYKIDKPKYEIAITAPLSEDGSTMNVSHIEFQPLDESGKEVVTYPVSIDDNDVAGTIMVTVNGEPGAFIDVLVYNVDFYTPTKFLMEEFIKTFCATLPVMIIISIVAAYFVSKRNEKVVRSFQDALDQLSNGEHGVKMVDSKIMEYQDIKKSIEKLDADLERHSRSRKEWIKNISHDLNTPVTSMNILLDGAEDGFFPVNMELVKSLKKENDTLTSRIASVSYYSYLLSPEVKYKPQVMRLLDVADLALQANGIDCTIDFSPEVYVYADQDLSQRALLEVLKNANAYKVGEGKPEMSVKEYDDRTSIIITNKGILPNPLPQFFEPWARGDESRTSGGPGLGLPIVYQIMELHSGSVSIAESDGIVAVTLTFPKKQ